MTMPRKSDIRRQEVGRKPTGIQWLWGMRDYPKFEAAQAGGYSFGYEQWKREGKPVGAQLTPRTLGVMGGTPFQEQMGWLKQAQVTPGGVAGMPPSPSAQAAAALGQVGTTTPTGGTRVPPPPMPTEALPWGYIYDLNEYNEWTPKFVGAGFQAPVTTPETITPYQQAQLDYQKQQDIQNQQWQQQQMEWYRQEAQMRQQEQERQYRSQLAASPMSWLQYASYTGEQPVIQPWMLPLMPQQYKGAAGTPIPGWGGGGQGQQGGGTGMSQLAPLFNPSAQYWARMGPTGQQQYMGYQQARGGATPEETQFRLKAQAPPGGRYGGFSWMR